MSIPSEPISPQQAKALQHGAIPGFVFEECNRLLALNLKNGRAEVFVPELSDAVNARMAWFPEYERMLKTDTRPEHWLSPENIRRTYEPAGWSVEYDRPAYYEKGQAKFIFTERR